MAKRRMRGNVRPEGPVESKVVDYAEELGRLLGTMRARVDGWGAERRALVAQLSGVVKNAQTLLSQLAEESTPKGGQRRAGGRKPAKLPKRMAGNLEAKAHRLPATTRQKLTARTRGKRRSG